MIHSNRDLAILPATSPVESNFRGLEDLWALSLVESVDSNSLIEVPGFSALVAVNHGTVVGYGHDGDIKAVIVQETSTLVVELDARAQGHVPPTVIEHQYQDGAVVLPRRAFLLRDQSAPERYRVLKQYFLKRRSAKKGKLGSATLQPELPLAAEYSPSDQVLSIWVESLNLIAQEASDETSYSLQAYRLPADRKILRREFTDRFLGTLATYALVKSYSAPAVKLSINRKFLYSFENQIFSTFLIAPSHASGFFDVLFDDLRSWLSSGRKIEGGWGSLLVDGSGDFSLLLRKRKKKTTRGFKPTNFE